MTSPSVESPTKVLESLDEPIRERVRRYAHFVRQEAGENAVSLTLYGPIAAGAFVPARHTVRNILILEKMDLSLLDRLARVGPHFGRWRISAPLIMTHGSIQASLDTFPLEFLEIRQYHLVVFGIDCFEAVAFHEEHMRLQCERELKTVLIGLRQGLLAAAGKEKLLGEIEVDIAESLVRSLRGLLWLRGHKHAKPTLQVIDEIERMTGRPLPGLRAGLDAWGRRGRGIFEALYEDAESLWKMVNQW